MSNTGRLVTTDKERAEVFNNTLRSKCDMDFYFGRFITVLKTWRTLIAAGNLYGVKQKPLCGLSENVTLHCL